MRTALKTCSTWAAQDEAAFQADRRASIRWRGDAPYPVQVQWAGKPHNCNIRDISAGGAALAAAQPAEVGAKVVVEINDAVRLPGFVLRTLRGGMAVKFDLPAHLAQQIERAIQLGLSPAEW